MKVPPLACAIYTRKSSEEGLEQGFNSLDAQREACEAYILSQKALGWVPASAAYDDGGFSGGNVERPAIQRLLADIAAQKVRVVVVYKVDRLTRSLADFAKMVDLFDAHGVSFVSVTQQFNTTTFMGRLTLNMLLSFAQFEREVTGERIRDKIAAFKRKGDVDGRPAARGLLRQRSNPRIPATELEAIVIEALIAWLTDETKILAALVDQETRTLPEHLRLARELAEQIRAEPRTHLAKCLQRVAIGRDSVSIAIWLGILAPDAVTGADEPVVVIQGPATLKRCGHAVRLIVKAPGVQVCRIPDTTLICRGLMSAR